MEFVHLEHFAVIGIEVRTSNAREMTKDALIPKQWGRFLSEGILGKISARADGNTVALYSEYASDENGEYSFLLGAKVSAVTEVPAGMTVKNTVTGRYAVFAAKPGAPEKVVPESWREIWAEPKTAQYTRTFRTDFEVYREGGRVEIYVGVRD